MTAMTNYAAARENMVAGQIRPNKVNDQAVVSALLAVPRELFVTQAARGVAYVDDNVPVGPGRYLIEPMVFARLIQEAAIATDESVLLVGAGSGYSAAVVSRLAGSVYALESDADLAQRAETSLAGLGVTNVTVLRGPLTAGYPGRAPYHLILVDGGVAELPSTLLDQVADGGRALAVVRNGPGIGKATLFLKVKGAVSSRVLFDAKVPMLPGFEPAPQFVF